MNLQNTADTWDSYKDTLERVVSCFKPKSVFEYGCGKSTDFFIKNVDTVDCVEHNPEWYHKFTDKIGDKFYIILEEDPMLYYLATGRKSAYDLIFVDGICRELCLISCKSMLNDNGVVILHDAERKRYIDSIDSYDFQIWTDDGHTVVLTNNEIVFNMLHESLEDLCV